VADRAGPLASLAILLRQGAPPSLEGLHAWFSQGEAYRDFVALVRQYLPQHETAILAEVGVERRLAAFARHFEDRYFPLPDAFKDGWVEEYEQLTTYIPVISMGISYEDYHMLTDGWRLGYQLLFVLPTDPYEEWREGAKTALLESCAQHVSKETLERTGQGFSRELLHARLDGTRFEPAALAADWLCNDTNNAFLDYTDEMNIEEPWDPETVRITTQQWARARDIQDRIHSLAEWLEVEPPARFKELLDFIEGKEPPASMTLEEWAIRRRQEPR